MCSWSFWTYIFKYWRTHNSRELCPPRWDFTTIAIYALHNCLWKHLKITTVLCWDFGKYTFFYFANNCNGVADLTSWLVHLNINGFSLGNTTFLMSQTDSTTEPGTPHGLLISIPFQTVQQSPSVSGEVTEVTNRGLNMMPPLRCAALFGAVGHGRLLHCSPAWKKRSELDYNLGVQLKILNSWFVFFFKAIHTKPCSVPARCGRTASLQKEGRQHGTASQTAASLWCGLLFFFF